MTIHRRHLLSLAAGALAAPAVSRLGHAQAYPSKPVRLLVGFPPGVAPDIIARLTAQALSERLGQQFIVDNRPGAASNIALEAAFNSPSDGYTLFLSVLTNIFNMSLYPNLRFNFLKDFTHISGLADAPYLLLVHPSLKVKTVPELIDFAKKNPGKINYASNGNGAAGHIFTELFCSLAGVDMVHVPYRGAFIQDVLNGQVPVVITPIALGIQYQRSGELLTLGVSTPKRLASLPDVPTISEFVPGYEAVGWYGLSGPKNLPPEILKSLNEAVTAVLGDAKVKESLANLSVQPMAMTPDAFSTFLADDHARWEKVIKDAKIEPN